MGAAVGTVVAGPIGTLSGFCIGAACTANDRSSCNVVSIALPQSSAAFSVHLPVESIRNGTNGVTYFGVHVQARSGGAPWCISRRYNSFKELRHQLASAPGARPFLRRLPRFPRKHLTGCNGMRLLNRRQKLEAWLRSALSQPVFSWAPLLQKFLECSDSELATGSQAPPTAVPAAPNTSTAAQQQIVQPPRLHEMMEIQVPPGAQPGQEISVQVPDGRVSNWRVPAGIAPGSKVVVIFNPVTGVFSIVDDVSAQAAGGQCESQSLETSSAPRQLVEVQIPDFVAPGQVLGVLVPDGRQVNFVVPDHAVAGAILPLLFEPETCALTEVTESFHCSGI